MFTRVKNGIVAILLAACSGCSGCGPVPTPSGTTPPYVPPEVPTTNGLVGADRSNFYHLPEGSEVYPLAWIKVLQTKDGNPFMENLARFGFLDDPDTGDMNPYRLPVGMTVAESRDLGNVQMIGVNCAACHVNDIYYQNKHLMRIDGAPNLFDLAGFYGELGADTEAVVTDYRKAWDFALALYKEYNPTEKELLLTASTTQPQAVQNLSKWSALMEGSDMEKSLMVEIKKHYDDEMKRPVEPYYKILKSRPATAEQPSVKSLTDHKWLELPKDERQPIEAALLKRRAAAVGPIKIGDLKPVAELKPSAASSLAPLNKTERTDALNSGMSHFVETLTLLRRRLDFLKKLAGQKNDPAPLFGRVDAFGGARNFLFPNQNLVLNAPVSYPHLWNLKQIKYFHWDANTTSLLERNVGQALGLGAIYDPDTGASTVLVANIEQLETLAGRITPPVWPEKYFGAIDQARRASGETLFMQHCLKCHKPLVDDGPMGDDKMPVANIGTDPLRAENFARPVNNVEFNVALSEALKKVTIAGGGVVKPENQWYITKSYADRPLVAPWATAPYLHNNSVATLDDLLKPAKDRLPSFPVGHREYDPAKLGYITENAGPPSVILDTTIPGNRNTGHEYVKDLSPDERKSLLEYLKSLK